MVLGFCVFAIAFVDFCVQDAYHHHWLGLSIDLTCMLVSIWAARLETRDLKKFLRE